MEPRLDRATYSRMYGPTTGDRVRLADTDLWAEVEDDHVPYGDEPLWGFGKTARDSMQATSRRPRDSEMDIIIANVVVIDPVLGILKTNIGVKEGRIVGTGRAGNPDITDDVSLLAGANTGWIMGEGMIATPGIVDPHVHLATTSVVAAALSAGTTTIVGMGYGHVSDVGVNPEYNFHRMMEAWEGIPMNVALLARGGASARAPLDRSMVMGAAGLKVHEDSASYTTVIDSALTVADEYDIPVCIHTDSNQEGGELEDTLSAIAGRTIHAFHIEGSGGGHPNVLELVGHPHVLGSSTTPTLPYSVNTLAEFPDMKKTVHRMHSHLAAETDAVAWRAKPGTIAAETLLQDSGAIAMVSSDSQGMGRIAEVSIRAWQTAHRNKELEGQHERNDNQRILRYIAKMTINPAIAQGLAHEVGSLEQGKLADIVLWRPEFFGVKPQLVLKNGFVAWGSVGSGNDSTRLGQPQIYRPMYGGLGVAPASLGVAFVSQASIESGLRERLDIRRRFVPVRDSRNLDKSAFVRNNASPSVRVDPDTLGVTIEGALADIPPAETLPMTTRYFI